MWYVEKKKNQAVTFCSDKTIACGNLKGIWAGSLWLLFAFVGKKLNFPSVRPINIERLMVEYGRSEAGLVKNLTGEGLYEPIVVSESEFVPWVVANWEKILMTAQEVFDDYESRLPPEYMSPQATCYLLGDAEPFEDETGDPPKSDDGDLVTLCDAAGGSDSKEDLFQEVLSGVQLESGKAVEEDPAPAQEAKKPPDYIGMCYRPIDPERPRPVKREVKRRSDEKPETEPEK